MNKLKFFFFFFQLLINKNADIVLNILNDINSQQHFSFNLEAFHKGKNLELNTHNIKLPNNVLEIIDNKNCYSTISKGTLSFSLGPDGTFIFFDGIYKIEKKNNKIVMQNTKIPFFKKTENLEYLFGIKLLNEKKISLNEVDYKIIKHSSITYIVMYKKQTYINNKINNFIIFILNKNNIIQYVLSCLNGDYAIFEIKNTLKNLENNKYFQ